MPTWPCPGLRCGRMSSLAVFSTSPVMAGVEKILYSPRCVVRASVTSHSCVNFIPTFSVSIPAPINWPVIRRLCLPSSRACPTSRSPRVSSGRTPADRRRRFPRLRQQPGFHLRDAHRHEHRRAREWPLNAVAPSCDCTHNRTRSEDSTREKPGYRMPLSSTMQEMTASDGLKLRYVVDDFSDPGARRKH